MEICARPLLIAGEHRCPTDLTSARLDHACLSRAVLPHALLVEADLSHADVRRADMRGASLCGSNLTGVDVRQALLDDADLTGATGIATPPMALGARLSGRPFDV
jgi:uncharacterized protein YjbI with pentapeptide repeats